VNKKNLTHLTKDQLKAELIAIGEKPFRAKQIWSWIYVRGVTSFDEMTDVSKKLREVLKENFTLDRPEISTIVTSTDGTKKWLMKFSDCKEVEVVFIPEKNRSTLCISSQVGCTLACKFCHTGTQTWVRNLAFHEIVAQILVAKDLTDDWDQGKKKLTNIVFMGMGEPLFNYENVAETVKILGDGEGLDFSSRRVTISTSGLVPEILRCAEELKTSLAISLHAPNDELRTEIMAINKKYPLKELMGACKKYNELNPSRKITFEYVMLKDKNDHPDHAVELIALIKKYNVNAKMNLIPFNKWDGCEYDKSEIDRIHDFQSILQRGGLISPIRKTRGDDVLAACGQLKSQSERVKRKKTH
jgi:23S rRNA (adenine2503-C2)-methyltransferase